MTKIIPQFDNLLTEEDRRFATENRCRIGLGYSPIKNTTYCFCYKYYFCANFLQIKKTFEQQDLGLSVINLYTDLSTDIVNN